jgi:DNA-binding transcriptional regulator YdaS (Cro superfamily)
VKRHLQLKDVQQLLRQRCDEAGGISAFADAVGANRQYVSQVISGHRPPSKTLCDVLGVVDDGRRWIKV